MSGRAVASAGDAALEQVITSGVADPGDPAVAALLDGDSLYCSGVLIAPRGGDGGALRLAAAADGGLLRRGAGRARRTGLPRRELVPPSPPAAT